jgi:hypothetical protein
MFGQSVGNMQQGQNTGAYLRCEDILRPGLQDAGL